LNINNNRVTYHLSTKGQHDSPPPAPATVADKLLLEEERKLRGDEVSFGYSPMSSN